MTENKIYGMILASASPRRKDILSNIGVKFGIFTADCDEYIEEGTEPENAVMLLSMKKCAASAKYFSGEDKIVIGADTVVVFENEILTKPKDKEDAHIMLKRLSGKTHSVLTGVSILRTSDAKCESFYEKTDVKFKDLTDEEISAYIATGEPLDKAGSYGIQGIGSVFIEKIDGDYFNVVGLPVSRLCEKLKNEFGINIITERQE